MNGQTNQSHARTNQILEGTSENSPWNSPIQMSKIMSA